MRRYSPYSNYTNPLEARLKAVENELYSARRTIISLVPEEYSNILDTYHSCQSTKEYWSWRNDVAAKIVERIPATSIRNTYYGEERADCPLCGSPSLGPYPNGFKIPVGLEHHLTGYGNAHHCPVTEAAFQLGHDYIESRFGEAERKAEAEAKLERERQLEIRRATETLYRTHPYEPPALIDEGYRFSIFGDARAVDKIDWAVKRVTSLGFTCHTEGNVKSFLLERPDYIVYADISPAKKITFNVFGKPLAKGKKLKRSGCELPDSYKNDLGSKFEDRLKVAGEGLRRR